MLLPFVARLLRFSLSGLVATGVNYGTLLLFLAIFGVEAVIATTLAFIISSGTNFFLQKFWTYGDLRRDIFMRQLFLWGAVSLLMLATNDATFWVTLHLAHASNLFAQGAATVVISIIGLIATQYLFSAPAPVGAK